MKIDILGAGISGLSAARLSKNNFEVEVLEKQASAPPLANAWILKNASLLILIPSIGLEAVVGGGRKNTSSACL
ncbi:NAD(P)-binding protein, partial [Campylobacter devanensis]|uniref:NAD(P)-binding protein n=1 Tax=Campylobacter devanensis TaxID=3161138 RepID=UPI0015D8E2DA